MSVKSDEFEIDEIVLVRFPAENPNKAKIIGFIKDDKYPVELIEDHSHRVGILIVPVNDIFKIKQ